MGFLFFNSAIFLLCFVLFSIFGFSPVLTHNLKERDAFCNAGGCFVVYFQPKIFLDSWRSCKEKGGNLATIKRKEDARAIAILFSTLDLWGSRTEARVWIGLQRQPRQCSSNSLRGFSWTTGDQDTEYTDWQRQEHTGMCSVPRCVSIGYSTQDPGDNFKWIDGSCSDPLDGYVCYYGYRGMCSTLSSGGSANIIYTTPFDLLSTILTHIPVGSTASVQCPPNADENKQVFCMSRKDGSVAWSHEPPFCSVSHQLCERDNGGCEHVCKQAAGQIFCDCFEGFRLGYDGQSCELDSCQEHPCEFECVPFLLGYRCVCPDGYMVASDKHTCLDVDECVQSPCQQLCKNLQGTFECECRDGYILNDMGECEDIDECLNHLCEHDCENTPGSYTCHCRVGYSVDIEDFQRCHDIDECQIGICEQMCVNYIGAYECFCLEGYELSSDHSTCLNIGDRHIGSATPPFPHVHQPEPGWDSAVYSWNPEQSSHQWPVNQERPLETVSNHEDVWVDDPSQDTLSFQSVTKGPEERDENLHLLGWEYIPQWQVNYLATTAETTLFPSSTSDSYEDYEDDATTTTTPFLTTSTIPGGAWNWWPVFSFTQGLENPGKPHTVSDVINEAQPKTYPPNVYPPGQESGREGEMYVEVTHSPGPTVPTPKPLPPFLDEAGGSGDNLDSVQEDKEHKQSNMGLLVGLLVPICIFLVVMVALGIFYCSHCGGKARNKNATECYHWISGAHDKQGTSGPSTGDKTPV